MYIIILVDILMHTSTTEECVTADVPIFSLHRGQEQKQTTQHLNSSQNPLQSAQSGAPANFLISARIFFRIKPHLHKRDSQGVQEQNISSIVLDFKSSYLHKIF